MRVRVLGAHQLETRDTRLTSFLIDGVVAVDAGSITSGLTLEEQESVEGILITHHHFDHCRDLLTFGLNTRGSTTDVYACPEVLESLSTNLVNGAIYPDHTRSPVDCPSLRFNSPEPGEENRVGGYGVVPVRMPHGPPTYGFQVTGPDGRRFFYSGDTGPGFSEGWGMISPDVAFIETSYPDRMEADAKARGHLTPNLLAAGLDRIRQDYGELPSVWAVHLNPRYEEEIKEDLAAASRGVGVEIRAAYEGLELEV